MKQHLNTLFVTTDGAYLSKDGRAVAVRIDDEVRLRVPLHNLDGIVALGRVSCSTPLMAAAAEAGITISLCDDRGRFQAAVVGFSPGNVLLRRTQYRTADDPAASLTIARCIVLGKLANSRTVLLRAARDANDESRAERLRGVARQLGGRVHSANDATTLDEIRGVEGEIARNYFAALPDLVNVPDPEFRFEKRTRRPPTDPLNALLSFVYAILSHDARSACEATGLDAAVGFLHRDRPGRPGLALDLVEEFRPFLADRLVLSLVNRGQVAPAGFRTLENGAVEITDDTRRAVLTAWQQRKQETITHPFLGERTTIGLLVHLQARLLARHLRGDLDAYPPFLWK